MTCRTDRIEHERIHGESTRSFTANIVGGGPAGLYAAILLKKQHPRSVIHVYEQNPPDVTWGFGVVFSDETLGNLEEADDVTYAEIRKQFAYWDAIDVHTWQGGTHQCIRSRGHGFCGMSRQKLLTLLQGRADELGVELHFESHVRDIDSVMNADLVIVADGINSPTRTRFENVFAPRFRVGNSRYIWLGTPQSFDEAFTFSFREDSAGLWQVHAYSFDTKMSTFILECDEETFQRSGLAEDNAEQTIAYAEGLFREELAGKPLLSNNSKWLRFRELHCDRWHHGKLVLLGDAAHTAHFSVGSGTKMALEDAIALANAVTATETFADALSLYEESRRPMIGKVQRAAEQSQKWFEETKRHVRLSPEQLTFSLLTRSSRITHENMRLRDSHYVDTVDRFMMNSASEKADDKAPTSPAGVTPPMFLPLRIRDVTLKNRIVLSPMCQYSAEDGVPSDWHLVHYGSRAVGGAGLLFSEMTAVSPEGRITPGCTGLWSDEQVARWKRITDFVHAQSGAKMAVQLGHAGRKGATALPWLSGYDVPLAASDAWPLQAPSALPWSASSARPREMTTEDMDKVTQDFVAAATRAQRSGFDIVEVHCAHGYLLSSFLSPLSNHRKDAFGGALENRAAFPLRVIRAVREAWAGALAVRISAVDWAPGGFELSDAIAFARWCKEAGVDLIDVSSGQTSTDSRPIYGRAYQTPFAEAIRNEVGIQTMTVGNIWDHDRINTVLAAGRADLVALARGHLADPYFTHHAADAMGLTATWPLPYAAAASIAPKMFGPA